MPDNKVLNDEELEKIAGGTSDDVFDFTLSIVSYTCPLSVVVNNIMSLTGVSHLEAKNMATHLPVQVVSGKTKRETLEIKVNLFRLGIQCEVNATKIA